MALLKGHYLRSGGGSSIDVVWAVTGNSFAAAVIYTRVVDRASNSSAVVSQPLTQPSTHRIFVPVVVVGQLSTHRTFVPCVFRDWWQP